MVKSTMCWIMVGLFFIFFSPQKHTLSRTSSLSFLHFLFLFVYLSLPVSLIVRLRVFLSAYLSLSTSLFITLVSISMYLSVSIPLSIIHLSMYISVSLFTYILCNIYCSMRHPFLFISISEEYVCLALSYQFHSHTHHCLKAHTTLKNFTLRRNIQTALTKFTTYVKARKPRRQSSHILFSLARASYSHPRRLSLHCTQSLINFSRTTGKHRSAKK